jgi:hypothetical protein
MTTEVNYFRYYCNTESNYVYKWDTVNPSQCPNNNSHTIDSNSITIIDTVKTNDVSLTNISKTQSQDIITGNKNVLLNLKSSYGKTQLRDNFLVQGNANIISTTGTTSEFQMLATGTTDKAVITSIERIPYCSHCTNEACLGIRIPQSLTNNQYIQFGVYDNSNGFYFKYTSTGLGVGYRLNGTDSNFTQSNLNIDVLNSNGISSVLLQPTNGYMYGIRISGTGSRVVDYGVYSKSVYGDQRFTVMHRIHTNQISNGIPTLNVNLPLNTEIFNNGTSGSNNVYLSERTFSVYGDFHTDMRQNSVYVSGVVVNSSNVFVPIASIRKKSSFSSLNVYLSSIDAVATTPQILQITSGSTLTNASWQSIPDQLSTETAIEYDESASVLSNDGIILWKGYVSEGKTTLNSNRYNGVLPKCILNGVLPITISTHNASSNGTLGLIIRTDEEW